MGHPIDINGVKARIAENDLLPALGGGVALKACLHILQQSLLQGGQLFKKGGAYFIRPRLSVQLTALLAALIQQGGGQQRAQVVVQTVQPVTGIMFAKITQTAAGSIVAGEDNFFQIPQDIDHRLAVRQFHALLQREQLVALIVFVQALYRLLDGLVLDLVHKRLLSPVIRPFAAGSGTAGGGIV